MPPALNVSNPQHRIAVVDDHSIILAVFRSLVEDDADLELAWTASCLKEALHKIPEDSPDLLILDVSLPDGMGYDLLPFVVSNYPHTKIMMVSSHEDREFAQRAHDLGACGYVTKNASAHELIGAIHTVLKDGTYFKPELMFQKSAH